MMVLKYTQSFPAMALVLNGGFAMNKNMLYQLSTGFLQQSAATFLFPRFRSCITFQLY